MLNMDTFADVVKDRLPKENGSIVIAKSLDNPEMMHLKIGKQETTIDLTNHYTVYINSVVRGQNSKIALKNALDSISGSLKAVNTSTLPDFNTAKDIIYPFIRHTGQVDKPGAIKKQFNAELDIYYAIDSDKYITFVTEQILSSWGISAKELDNIANMNFFRDKDIPPIEIKESEFKFYIYQTYDGYDATRIMLSNNLAEVHSNIGKCLVGIPNRDFLIIFPKNPFIISDFFIRKIKLDYKTRDHAITDSIFEYKNGLLVKYK